MWPPGSSVPSGIGIRNVTSVSMPVGAGRRAIIGVISAQQSPATCLAVPWSGQGTGGGASSGHSIDATNCNAAVASLIAPGGTIRAIRLSNLTRRRTAFTSAPAAYEYFEQLVDLGLALAFGAALK